MEMTAKYKKKESPAAAAVQRQEKAGRINRTGMPDCLKSSIESMSGYSMETVRVHYNSPEPAKLQALAYTQGTDIHVAPGQERHLPHEAWHVVQQMQGRVRPTMRIQGVGVNGSPALEHEADVMGKRAVQGYFLHNPVKARPVKGECVQAVLPALPRGVNWGTIYQGIADGTAFEGRRTIQDSKELIRSLNRFWRGDGYQKRTLEEGNGLRRLAYDIKRVKTNVKRAAGAAGNPFGAGNLGFLNNAQQLINNKIREIENQKYGTGRGRAANYINQENPVHFNNMKNTAIMMLHNVQGRDNAYLERYFNPGHRRVFAPGKDDAYYRGVKRNFQRIALHLNNIGYKDNYSQRAGVYAYVYPGQRQPGHAVIGGVNVGGTRIRSKMHHGAETGLKIRLASAYRRAPERGRDSKPGVIIHEASHLILGTKDHAYGSAILGLNWRQAITNADTYEYAAEDA